MAQVSLGVDHIATTDDQGRYQLLNVTSGAYTLHVRCD